MMAGFAVLRGVLKVVQASSVFGLTTLGAGLASQRLMAFWRGGWWDLPQTVYAIYGLSIIAFFCSADAFIAFGASGAFGEDKRHDFKDLFIRLFLRHLLFLAGFLAPLAVIAHSRSLDPLLLIISFLSLYFMVRVDRQVNPAVVERIKQENLGDFLGGVGKRTDKKPSKGVRRK